MQKVFLSFLLAIFSLTPVSVFAQTTLAPEFNPLCWQAEECGKIRASIVNVDFNTLDAAKKKEFIDQGWIKDEEPCDKAGWGKCLPANKTTTEIAFGGKKEFLNIGDFIKVNYNYFLAIISVLAVLIIIIAGVQWTVSAGSAEVINSAKKRIGGALIGLVIAYLSFAILQTINPALVNLRLPQTWLIRPQKLAPEFCNEIPEVKEFALAAENGKNIDPATYTSVNLQTIELDKMNCGNLYFFKGGGKSTCSGDKCEEEKVCVKINNKYNCEKGILAGSIDGSIGNCLKVVDGNNNAKFMMMCKNGAVYEIEDVDVDETGKRYFFGAKDQKKIYSKIDDFKNKCGGLEQVVGFYIGLEVNDESSGSAKLPLASECSSWSFGIDDWHAVGRSSGHNCDVNLSKLATEILDKKNNTKGGCGGDNQYCSCSFMSMQKYNEELVKDPNFISKLLTWEEIVSIGGFQCNIKITREQFPSVDNSVWTTIGKAVAKEAVGILLAGPWGGAAAVGHTFLNSDPTDCLYFKPTFGY